MLTLFNISHFSSTACIAAMAKRAQQESGEERVTAKSRPMMNLTARTPSVVSSSTSSNPGRTSYGYQDPGKSVPSDDRRGKLVQPSRPDFSQKDYGRSWSSQEWKSGAAERDRSGKPEEISWNKLSHLGVKIHEDGFHFWYQRAEVIRTIILPFQMRSSHDSPPTLNETGPLHVVLSVTEKETLLWEQTTSKWPGASRTLNSK